MPRKHKYLFRDKVRPDDVELVGEIVRSTGFFTPDEVAIAMELVEEHLSRGPVRSGYYFTFCEVEGQVVGYACFGPIAGTKESFDLFWIAVSNFWRGKGLGRAIIHQSENIIQSMGGHRIYVETSSRDQYLPTLRFYMNNGYLIQTTLDSFYSPGDGKIILLKMI